MVGKKKKCRPMASMNPDGHGEYKSPREYLPVFLIIVMFIPGHSMLRN